MTALDGNDARRADHAFVMTRRLALTPEAAGICGGGRIPAEGRRTSLYGLK